MVNYGRVRVSHFQSARSLYHITFCSLTFKISQWKTQATGSTFSYYVAVPRCNTSAQVKDHFVYTMS